MKRVFLLFLLLFFLTQAVSADTKVANDPTRIGVGARLLGMGKAYVGLADDMSSIFLNPSGLSNLDNWQATSMSGKFINEVNYLCLSGAYPSVKYGNFSIGYVGSDIGFTGPAATTEVVDGVRIVPSSTEGVSYSYKNSVLLFGWGVPLKDLNIKYLEPLAVGTTLKVFSQGLSGPGISGGSANGYEMDLGAQYKYSSAWRIGGVIQNALPTTLGGKIVWASGNEESLPSVFKLGTSLKVWGEGGLYQFRDYALNLNLDYDFTPLRSYLPSLWHVGAEWSPLDVLDIRLGIDQDIVGKGGGVLEVANNITYGIGLFASGWRFDYAYHQYYAIPENDTHYFSLSYGVWKKKPKPKPPIVVISPDDKTILYGEKVKVFGEINDANVKRILVNSQEAVITKNYFEVEVPINIKKNPLLCEGQDSKNRTIAVVKIRVLRLVTFKDVDANFWAKAPVERLATLGIITGYPDGTFKPYGWINRAEFVTLLVRTKELNLPTVTQPPFKDVEMRHWAAGYIKVGSDAGLVKGYPDLTFRPARRISRAEGVSVTARFAELSLDAPVYEAPFPDVPGRHWAIREIYAAKNGSLLKYLEDKSFEPNKDLTRGEVAEILSRTKYISGKVEQLLDWETGY